MTRIHLLTLGCAKNEADSRAMAGRLADAGFVLEADPDLADVLLVNTCAFISDAAEESVDTVLEAATVWKPESSGRKVVVVGCLPSRYSEEVASEIPEVDAFVPVADESDIVATIVRVTGSSTAAPVAGPHIGPFAYLNVCDGCDRTCSFCTIPSIRGGFRSRPAPEVADEARRLVEAGARELVLVGQDVSSYGRDGGTALRSLIRDLSHTDDLLWLRLLYLQPDGIDAALLEAIASEPTICDYLDVPLQHASRSVLRGMRRSGDAESFLQLIDDARTAIPDVVLRTTLIAGFPGETEDDVETLLGFLREARIDHVGVFRYSPEEGTHAASLPGQLPEQVIHERAQLITDTADEIAFERLRELRGCTLGVLVDDIEDGMPVGRWYGQAPEVDGVVHLDRTVAVGDYVDVTVEDSAAHDLIATVLT